MAGKFLCPRCFELQSIESVEYICTNTSATSRCQHAIDRMPQRPANAKKPVCGECGQPLVTKVCPKCGGELPLNIGTAKSYPIAIIGAKETGKSNYVAVLINQLALSWLLNSFWISVLFGSPYQGLLFTRIFQCAILGPVQFRTIILIIQGIVVRLKRAAV